MKATVIGDINLDIVSFVDKLPCEEDSLHPRKTFVRPGGAALNTAISLSINSIKVSLISSIGDDVVGDFILNKIKKFIDISFIQRVKSPTGMVHVLVKDDKKAMIGFKGANEFLRFDKEWIHLLSNSDAIHISPYLFSNKEGFKIFNNIKDIVKKKILTLSFSKTLLKKKKKILNILNNFSYIFMNEEEAKEFKDLFKYINRVIITKGRDGAIYKDKEKILEVEGKEGRIFNPVGAGDFFVGGFLSGVLDNLSIKESLIKGVESSYKLISTPTPIFDI